MHSQRRELAGIPKAMPMQLATKVVECRSAIAQAQGLFAVLLRATVVFQSPITISKPCCTSGQARTSRLL